MLNVKPQRLPPVFKRLHSSELLRATFVVGGGRRVTQSPRKVVVFAFEATRLRAQIVAIRHSSIIRIWTFFPSLRWPHSTFLSTATAMQTLRVAAVVCASLVFASLALLLLDTVLLDILSWLLAKGR